MDSGIGGSARLIDGDEYLGFIGGYWLLIDLKKETKRKGKSEMVSILETTRMMMH